MSNYLLNCFQIIYFQREQSLAAFLWKIQNIKFCDESIQGPCREELS